jgi:predicted aspartyl protease
VKETPVGPDHKPGYPPGREAKTAKEREKPAEKRKVYLQEGRKERMTLGKPRDGLLRIGATVGNATMPAVIDTGAFNE